MKIRLGFYGAAGNVTGSCYLLRANGKNILIDCGLYQEHHLKDRNWGQFPLQPSEIDAVVLTHAHLDHCGRLPRLVKEGFRGPIYSTSPTAEIARIVMDDCGKINEEDAEFKRLRHLREGRKGPHDDKPLYTQEDAEEVVPLFSPWDEKEPLDLGDGITVQFIPVGHILGASSVRFVVTTGTTTRSIVFSGDIGRHDMPILRDPDPVGDADYLVVESTYGDRLHPETADIPAQLAQVINETVKAGGNIIIPSFAIERTQELLYFLALLLAENKIPHLRIFLDSPMATKVNTVFMRHPYLFDEETIKATRQLKVDNVTVVRSATESKSLNHIRGSVIIIAGSGMCTGGRIKHHLTYNIGRKESTILFVGYQAVGTLGREIVDGKEEVRILGEMCPVHARVDRIEGFSAHADQGELLAWLKTVSKPPKHVFVTHGEPEAAEALRQKIAETTKWEASTPKYQEVQILN